MPTRISPIAGNLVLAGINPTAAQATQNIKEPENDRSQIVPYDGLHPDPIPGINFSLQSI